MLAIDEVKVQFLANLFRSRQSIIVAANSSHEEIIDTVLFCFSMALFNGDRFLKQSHPDVFILGNQANQLLIDDVRRAEEFTLKSNIELKTQLLIVFDICKVMANQANALLKLVEESASKDYVVVFITSAPVSISKNVIQGVLSTILSRCFLVFLSESFTEASTKEMISCNKVRFHLDWWRYLKQANKNSFVGALVDMANYFEDKDA